MSKLISEVYNEDCMQLMARYPDKYFDLAVVDPPYGIARFGNRVELSNRLCNSAKLNTWDVKPPLEYFIELFRVSKYQIIWGANNFDLPTTEYFIVWDKEQTVDNFASAELAYTNIKCPAKVFRYSIHKHNQEHKVHPTQKPLALMRWCLSLVPEAQTVLDPYMGSGTTLLAAKLEGRKAVGIDVNEKYCESAAKRLSQGTLF